jgi:DNA-binding transcriptional regulator YdaS (Cro superfamily)
VQKKAAELLKIKPTTLNEMIKRYEIGTRRRKSSSDEPSARSRPFPAAELTRE